MSLMLWLKGDVPGASVPVYVAAQVAGALLALAWVNSKPRALAAVRG